MEVHGFYAPVTRTHRVRTNPATRKHRLIWRSVWVRRETLEVLRRQADQTGMKMQSLADTILSRALTEQSK
jgi:hypothetical protein